MTHALRAQLPVPPTSAQLPLANSPAVCSKLSHLNYNCASDHASSALFAAFVTTIEHRDGRGLRLPRGMTRPRTGPRIFALPWPREWCSRPLLLPASLALADLAFALDLIIVLLTIYHDNNPHHHSPHHQLHSDKTPDSSPAASRTLSPRIYPRLSLCAAQRTSTPSSSS